MTITIKTLPQATLQQVFDQVAVHLLTQNKKAQGTTRRAPNHVTTVCLYRSPDGCKCAAGCIIADDEYKPAFERKAIVAVIHGYFPEVYDAIDNASKEDVLEFLQQLQRVHDKTSVDTWEMNLRQLATEHQLSTKAIDDYLHHKNSTDSTGESERPAS